jgi:phenylacetate-CoA ligase
VLLKKATGGSSGVPLAFDLNPDSNDRRMAAWHRGYSWGGAGPGTKQWYLWGTAIGDVSRARRWKDALYNRLYRRRLASCFELSEARIPWFLADLNRYRPDCIVSYTNPLYSFARSLEERGVSPWSPASIIVGAEKLHDFQRELIERVFQAPVFETYGSREFMLIGGECDRHCGLHLTMENLLVEIVDDDGSPTPPGEEGNVVVTDLTIYWMPFIRYLNGDREIAGFGVCSCGRGLPLLKKVVGRRLDMLETPDGRRVPGELFPHLIKDFPAVRRFQVVQEAPEAIQVKLVVGPDWREETRRLLTGQIKEVIGPSVALDVVLVDDIPLTAAGKLRVVVRSLRDSTTQLCEV